MQVQVKHFLACRFTRRLPDVESVRGERARNAPRYPRCPGDQGGASAVVELKDVRDVRPGDDEHVPRVWLAQVHERHREGVLPDNAGGLLPRNDGAEQAP